MERERRSEFDTTHWSLIAAAAGPDRKRALDYVYRAYAGPLRAFARRAGVGEDDADDVLHDFLLRVFSTGSLERATSARGRFRSYLLGALRHFLAGEWQRKQALKRGGGVAPISLDGRAGEPGPEVAAAAEDDRKFDEEWAAALVEHAIRSLGHELEQGARGDFPVELHGLVFRDQPGSYGEVAAALGITLPAVKSRIFRLRKRFREIVRAEVARTVADPAEVDDELRYLCGVLGASWVD